MSGFQVVEISDKGVRRVKCFNLTQDEADNLRNAFRAQEQANNPGSSTQYKVEAR